MGQNVINTQIHEAWSSNSVILDYQHAELVCRLVDGDYSESPAKVDGELKRVRVRAHCRAAGLDDTSPWCSPADLKRIAGALDRSGLVKMMARSPGLGEARVGEWLLRVPESLYNEVMSGVRAWARGTR